MTLWKGDRSTVCSFCCLICFPVLSATVSLASVCYGVGITRATDISAGQLKDHPKITIAGVCKDEQGKPVVGAEVRIYARYANCKDKELLRSTRSDSNGNFHLGEFPKPGLPGVHYGHMGQSGLAIAPTLYHVFLLKKDMATQVFSLPRNNPDHFEAMFKLAAELKGRVIGPDNLPVAGASVYLAGWVKDEIGSSTTNPEGRFVISDIPASQAEVVSSNGELVPASRAGLVVEHPDFGDKQAFYTQCPGTVEIRLEEPAIVEGSVVYRNGRPAAKIKVGATSTQNDLREGRWGRATGLTGDEGTYRVMLQGARTVKIKVYGVGLFASPLEEFRVTPGTTKEAPPITLQQASAK